MIEKQSDIVDVIMKENILVFSDQLLTSIGATAGDKISIGYCDRDGNLSPVIGLSEDGNKLSKSNTIAFRGHQKEVLAQFGSRFWLDQNDGISYLKGDGIPIFTSVKKAVNTYLTKEIIEDTNFNITKLYNYEF